MAKDKITDYSATSADNVDIGGVGIQGTNAISNLDNAQREIMSHLAETNAGTAPWADSMTIGDTADLTKELRFELSAITTGNTRVITMPDANVTIPSGTLVTEAGTQTLTNKTLTTPTITLKQSATPTPTAEGDVQWDTDDNVLAIGDGAATKLFLPIPASTASGDIEYYTAAKVKARLAKGTANQVLRMNSGATAPEWGGAGIEYINEGSPSAVAVLDFTGLAAYREIFVAIVNASHSSGSSQTLQLLLSNDNGSTFTAGTFSLTGSLSAATLSSPSVHLLDWNAAGRKTIVINESVGSVTQESTVAEAHNAFRFQYTAGNFDGGRFVVYGVPA